MEHTAENRDALFGGVNKALEQLLNFVHKPDLWKDEDNAEHMRLLESWSEAKMELYKYEHWS